MAQGSQQQSVAILRAITLRLTSTPTKQLPQATPQLAGLIWNCKELLSSPCGSTKQSNDASIIVNRFRTQLSTLLQDRTIEGRWAAVVLVKATVEAGGHEVLSKSNAWIRSLLSILKKPDPPSTRSLAVITLTRIFMLTWDHSNLVREVTTPALPALISSCLHNSESKRCSASELQTILEAFATLLPRHPTIFRTHETQIRSLVCRIVSSKASNLDPSYFSASHITSAQRLLVLLHHCQPKQGGSEKWDETLKCTITAAHATCDRVFRSVVEGWRSTAGVQPSLPAHGLSAGDVELEYDDAVGLTGWKGMYAGSERLMTLLELLEVHLAIATSGTVIVRVGTIIDLINRLLSLTIPQAGKQDFVQFNQQISKDERETLFIVLPRIHKAALGVVQAILSRFGLAVASVIQPLLELMTLLFKAEKADDGVRAQSFRTLKQILELIGPSMGRDDVHDLSMFVTSCCKDLLPASNDPLQTGAQNKSVDAAGLHLAAQSNTTQQNAPSDIYDAANDLLPVLLSKLDPRYVPRKVRALMDRTAILTRHKQALLASVLGPQPSNAADKSQASMLPLLAKLFPDGPEVEALLRPRMPFIRNGGKGSEDLEMNGYHDDEDVSEAADNEDAISGAEEQAEENDGDLLSTLEKHVSSTDQQEDGEDLYSASPMAQPQTETVPGSDAEDPAPEASVTSNKRSAPSDEDGNETSAKRMRALPIASSLLPDSTNGLPGPGPATAAAPVPTAVLVAQPDPNVRDGQDTVVQTSVLPAQPSPAPPTGNVESLTKDDDSDLGSDFEMPPLTLEQSDEEEDEDDEE